MRDLIEEEFLSNRENFAPQEEYKCIEASCPQEASEAEFHRHTFSELDLLQWIQSENSSLEGPRQQYFRLLALAGPYARADSYNRMPCSLEVYKTLCGAWNLPATTTKILTRIRAPIIANTYTNSLGSTFLGFAFRESVYRLSLSYDIENRMISVLMIAREPDELQKLFSELDANKIATCCPALSPLLAVESGDRVLEDRDALTYRQLLALREEIGMDLWNGSKNTSLRHDINLPRIMKDLTELSEGVAANNWHQQKLHIAVKEIRRLHEMYLTGTAQQIQEPHLPEYSAIAERLNFLEAIYIRNELIYPTRATQVQAQIQTVYSMIATQDNKLNYDAAESSLQISRDSRRVAILARQDSTDMRIIAGATLIFLPATFVATLFSTAFFNFHPAPSDGPVSSWIWIYFTITTLLTVLLLAIWRYLSNLRARETTAVLEGKNKAQDAMYRRPLHRQSTSYHNHAATGVDTHIPQNCLQGTSMARRWNRREDV